MNTLKRSLRLLIAALMIVASLALISTGAVTAQDNGQATGTVVLPTVEPTVAPTDEPTVAPTSAPTIPPTDEPTVVPTDDATIAPTESPALQPAISTASQEPKVELSRIVIYKYFCATIDETSEDWCVGRVPAAEGTKVDFVVTSIADNFSQTFPVKIDEVEGYTFGAIAIFDVPFGTYTVTEIVPTGYEAYAFAMNENQSVNGLTITVEVGVDDEETLYVNLPIDQGTSTPTTPEATSTPTTPEATSTPTTPEATSTPISTSTVPSTVVPPTSVPTTGPTTPALTPQAVTPPAVTPPAVSISEGAAVTTLPSTGQGESADSTAPLVALGLVAASIALGAVALRRYRREA